MRTRAVVMALLLSACNADDPEASAGSDSDGIGHGGAASAPDAGGASHGGASGTGRGGASGAAVTGASGTSAGQEGGAGGPELDSGSAGADAAADADADAAPEPDAAIASCLDGIGGYDEQGPFEWTSAQSGSVRVWIPDVPAGCKLPVVHFANGTGATCGAYAGIVERLASHGFLTACNENPAPDDGSHCIAALQTVFSEYPDLADPKIGSIGQEAGGAVAILCLYQAEREWGDAARYAGHAIAPASGFGGNPGTQDWVAKYAQVEAPMFMFNGSEDVLVSASWVRMAYDALSSEKYWYEASGAPHIPIPVSWAAESAVVFFRWKLLDDAAAGEYFAAMPDSDRWDLQERDPAP